MKIRSILDDAVVKGEKLKAEIINELFKSKTIQDLVSNRKFVKAVTRIIETKHEVQKVIGQQVKNVFDVMDVPTALDFKKISQKLGVLEKMIDKVGRSSITVKPLKKTAKAKTAKKRTTAKRNVSTVKMNADTTKEPTSRKKSTSSKKKSTQKKA